MVETANTIFRDFVAKGVRASGPNKPQKAKIRDWGTWLESVVSGGLASTLVKTAAALKALDTGTYTKATLAIPGRYGDWVWTLGDYSALIAADASEAISMKAELSPLWSAPGCACCRSVSLRLPCMVPSMAALLRSTPLPSMP
ncbi:hypothetical protein [Mesorhizobium sp.]|uniref:hypothetical protein n=1 Tax=Mesorhizobium sp. TaxID=1871066 RepID=UPI000FE35C16|nr:hypothetical protein [Mesorhizobium sp.]RWH65513.1 MAG: hypothetical protein EOQ84_32350 [Mesorhizobium sp.]RWL19285.1 MAG: hypothetical protein EOR58_32280 [Mesorhizobium sp.]RWL22283.1 MAG: hypothetical protein EOR63_32560 [Mesorhizobium sp.]RWL26731.1 MAG: hypothetical protein EOR59_32330 [Mesorhizobium sp.]RWL42112.1 MAG: hypothetical protein EOR61_32370 [Mesorhizobium sp.]